ncbi:MAG: type II toxin-antitoxin system RelE/ParE family toxin [Cyanobium sp.]
MFDLLSLQGLRFSLKLATTIELKRLGTKFLEAVEDATARALAYPLAGSPAQHITRRVFLRDFPFSLVYRSDEQGITIYALAHHARRPARLLAESHR